MADDHDPVYARMFDAHPDPMWVYDRETLQFLKVNAAAVAYYGYSREEFLGMTIKDIRPAEDGAKLERSVRDARDGLRNSGVWRHLLASGRIILVEIESHSLDWSGRAARVVIARDVTDRREMEAERGRIYERLRQSEERYREIFEQVPISIWVEDWSEVKAIIDRLRRQGVRDLQAHLNENPELVAELVDGAKVLDISTATLALFRTDNKSAIIERMSGSNITAFERAYFIKELLAFCRGVTVFHHEGMVEAFDGAEVLVDSTAFLPTEARSDWSRVLTLVTDVTEARKIRQKLRESEERYRRIVETSPDVVCLIDREGRFLEVSERASSIYGFSPAELIGTDSLEIVHPDDRVQTREAIKKAIETLQVTNLSNRNICKDGEIKNIHWSALWSTVDEELLCTGRDVTEWIHAEAQVRRSQRLEAVGQLTGGVAHDFNNLLQAINASLDAIAESDDDPEQRQEMVCQAFGAVRRGSDLTRQLLAFSRQQPLSPMPVQLTAFVEALLPLMQRTLGEQVAITFESEVASAHIFVDAAQLDSAILNLALNARDAMPGGGHLTFRIKTADIGKLREEPHELVPFGLHDLDPGEYFVLEVSDDGEGMDEDTKSRIFEPFFTTKEVGKGSGLGLSMVFGFMAQSKGKITVYSEMGHGTTFRLYFKSFGEMANLAGSTEREARPAVRREARVLVVEDNEVVRKAAVLQLRGLGYDVTQAADGNEALEILGQDSDFALLFSDVVMPGGIDGVELADRALEINPSIRILLTSGFPQSQIDSHGYRLLSKPYRKNHLVEVLEQIIVD